VYVVWGSDDPATNTTEVMFRVSGDGGQTYEDKINLSNSTGSDSTDFDVEATDDNVIVSWWGKLIQQALNQYLDSVPTTAERLGQY
jgi:hypothetical protein